MNIESTDKVLAFIAEESNRLEEFQEGLGTRFNERLELLFDLIKKNYRKYPSINDTHKQGTLRVMKKNQYAVYFQIQEDQIFVDSILPTSINPDLHPK